MSELTIPSENRLSQRRQCLRLAVGSAALVSTPFAAATPALAWRERLLLGFGTTMWLRAAHANVALLDKALDEAVQHLRDIEGAMSLFSADSEVSRLNRSGVLRTPSPHLLSVLRQSAQIAQASGGLFDISVQPLWQTWSVSARRQQLPSAREIRTVRDQINWRAVQVSPEVIRFGGPGMAITLNGIAQGYAADQVAAVMRRHGIEHALLDTGEWASLGQAPAGADWSLGLENPVTGKLLLKLRPPRGTSVAVSTNALSFFGAAHHHILDPRTGDSPRELAAVAVVAPRATLADALTKPMFMAGAAEALGLANRWGVHVVTIDKLGRWAASPSLRTRLSSV